MYRISLLLLALLAAPLTAETGQLTLSTLKGMLLADNCSQVLEEAYEHLGITVDIEHYPAKRSLSLSNSGMTDGEVMRIKGAEALYPNLVRVPVAICVMESKVYSKNQDLQITGWESMADYKIGIVRGHLYAAEGTQGMDVTEVHDTHALFKMLKAGRIDVAVAITTDALKTIHTQQLEGVYSSSSVIYQAPLYHYLHAKHSALVPELAQTLQTMNSSGRIAAIRVAFENSLSGEDPVAKTSELPNPANAD
ncbi:substrate-binding periplasmic protein [Aliagarivorans taiwanensis]|uniref:substrate-binding periplasmic protein n=1 Tax=Aliagarivorans taiwanensis TaxID=561966 RepID=UPI0003FC39A7|nr:transporter substrate-binding domain-containing protein [Aliagarivorans taiwanensis]